MFCGLCQIFSVEVFYYILSCMEVLKVDSLGRMTQQFLNALKLLFP